MKHSIAKSVIAIVLVLSTVSFGIKYSGGSGTQADPYKIATKEDLLNLRVNTSDYGKYFILTADINLAGQSFPRAVIAPDTDEFDKYSEFHGTVFTGNFDGIGHVIRNLTINGLSQDYIGLFGYVGSGGQISNLGVENVDITGRDYVGGLAGQNAGMLTSCYATGSVTGADSCGGLVGYNNSGKLTSCYVACSLAGDSSVGGLLGDNYSGKLTKCYSIGSAAGIEDSVGGLIGQNYSGTLTSCYATNSASGNYYVGGLVGYNSAASVLINSYAAGSAAGKSHVGGLVGFNNSGSLGTIAFCYSTGWVTGNSHVGGLMGSNSSGILNACFWDTSTSGQTNSAGGTGEITALMKTRSTFTTAGWNFSTTSGNWKMPNNDYPRLIWETPWAPTGVSATDGKYTDNVMVTWTASVGAAAYDIYRYTSNHSASSAKINLSDVTGTSYNDTSAASGTIYWYWVKAKNISGSSGFSGGNSGYTIAPPSQPMVSVQKCSVTAGKENLDSLSFSGLLNAADSNFIAAMDGSVEVIIDCNKMHSPLTFEFPINSDAYKKGKYKYTSKDSFNFDTNNHKFAFASKKIDLTGLACPITVTITIGDYSAQTELDETIVNRTKLCPFQLMMGAQNNLEVTKYKLKQGKIAGTNTDSLTAQGIFYIDGIFDTSESFVIGIGSQTFTVPYNLFTYKSGVYSCKNIPVTGGLVTAKLDTNKCTFTISITKASIEDVGVSNFNLNFFGHPL